MFIELFHISLMRMRKTLELKNIFAKTGLRKFFDTGIMKKLKKFQYRAKKLSSKKTTCTLYKNAKCLAEPQYS